MGKQRVDDVEKALRLTTKLPYGYTVAVVPEGFIEAVREYFETGGNMPIERGDYKSGYSERSYNHTFAYNKLSAKVSSLDILPCLADSEWDKGDLKRRLFSPTEQREER